MRKILTFDGPIIQFFHKTGELIIATMLFLLFCIPIVTAGASATSFYYAVMKSVRRDRGYVTSEFMRSLRRTIGKGSILTVGILVWFGLLWFGRIQADGHMALAYNALIIVSVCVSVYIFPVLSRFEMRLIGIVKLSFVMSIRYFYYTIPILIGTALLVWFQYFYLPIPCIFVLPGVWCYATTFVIEKALLGYELASKYLDYAKSMLRSLIYAASLMAIQVFICSMVGYGFARYQFPGKNILFACVVIMIVIPTNTIMLPLYMTFAKFDVLGIMKLIKGSSVNLLSTPVPMYIMTLFGCGLRSGLYIYIFNQFFRGLPKEIEEAAFVDGAGTLYTYFRIMLVNALPSAVTVAIFSMVWQYNDTFYAKLFLISDSIVISKKISTITATISTLEKILDPAILQLFLDAGIVLVMIPIVIIYVLLQKQFIEGVERSGIVG